MPLCIRPEQGQDPRIGISTADAASTLSAALSTYGWLGGLDGLKDLLCYFPNTLEERVKQLPWNNDLLSLSLALGFLLTGDNGPRKYTIDLNNDNHQRGFGGGPFGGTPGTKLIGLTLCALAHNANDFNALKLFKYCVLPVIFKGTEEERVTGFYGVLNDDATLRRILNEGAARGLTALFESAIDALLGRFREGDRKSLQKWLTENKGTYYNNKETDMVGGLLRWLLSKDAGVYYTRSGLVIKAAICLKSIGYKIGEIRTWHGAGEVPEDLGPKAVLLVRGGPLPNTDPMALSPDRIINETITLHYRFETTGEMLLAALENRWDDGAAVLQARFEETYRYVKSHFGIGMGPGKNIIEPPRLWFLEALPNGRPTPEAKRMAAIYFPRSAKKVALCYNSIATKQMLVRLQGQKEVYGDYGEMRPEILLFRAVTASIVISLVSRFLAEPKGRKQYAEEHKKKEENGANDFETTQHSTIMDLMCPAWLEYMCEPLDKALVAGIPYEQAVHAIAAIHCAQCPELIGKSMHGRFNYAIAWRSGIYSVVPDLLLSPRHSPKAARLRCLDGGIWANVRTEENGAVVGITPAFVYNEQAIELARRTINEMSASKNTRTSADMSVLHQGDADGHPHRGPLDDILSLTFEPALHTTCTDLCLVARIKGSVVGTRGITDVLSSLFRNHLDYEEVHERGTEDIWIEILDSVARLRKVKNTCREYETSRESDPAVA